MKKIKHLLAKLCQRIHNIFLLCFLSNEMTCILTIRIFNLVICNRINSQHYSVTTFLFQPLKRHYSFYGNKLICKTSLLCSIKIPFLKMNKAKSVKPACAMRIRALKVEIFSKSLQKHILNGSNNIMSSNQHLLKPKNIQLLTCFNFN